MIFTCHTLEQHTQVLADYLPNGELFAAKNIRDSLYRMFLRGLAHTEQDAESFLCLFDKELDIRTTTAFLEEWEATVGIPDDCFTNDTDIETRRAQVLIKLAALGVQTEQEFVDLAALYGVQIEIDSGSEHNIFTLNFPLIFFQTAKVARFTMIVFYDLAETATFTYTYPIPFGNAVIPILECLFRKLVPANVDLLFLRSDLPDPVYNRAFSLGFSAGFA